MHFLRHALLPLLAISNFVPATLAQCDDWRTGPVQNDQTQNGSDGVVYSLTAWNPGSSMQQPMLVAGGNFTRMEDASVQNIAVFDPSTDQWSPLGADLSTFNSEVHAAPSLRQPTARRLWKQFRRSAMPSAGMALHGTR